MFDLSDLTSRILTGGEITYQDRVNMSSFANGLLNGQNHQFYYQIINLCNLIYNNLPNIEPLIPDELYDRLIVYAKNNNIEVPVGAPPLNVESMIEMGSPTDQIMRDKRGKIEVVKVVPDYDKRLFYANMTNNSTPPNAADFVRNHDTTLVTKKQRAVGHNYNMCGTLDKCKYVLNFDAQSSGVLQDNTISIFERDFLYKSIADYHLDHQNLEIVLTLKYDGISVENTILKDEIIYSVTRGDLNTNEASDMTPVFGGMKFARAVDLPYPTDPFGIKFEYILLEQNKKMIEARFNKSYVNLRNAVIGITGGLDARLYRDYLTPVPLESSLVFQNRVQEIQWLNRYYTKGVDCRWAYVVGNYSTILDAVKRFVDEAESLREYMDFAYDGVVVEFNDNNIRQMMGKRGNIPRYAIAIKFDPLKRKSIFTHYTYSVGQDGSITPMAHFEPVEFFGAVHDKTTAHSYKRFLDLGLHVGDRVTLTLNNDVIVYIRRAPECEQDPNNHNPLVEFPQTCPSCGQPLYISDSGDSVYCINLTCPERVIARMANCLKKLSFKDFSTETVRALGVKSFKELYNYDREKMTTILGPVNSQNLIKGLEDLKNAGLSDARLIGAVGFNNIAEKTWKLILEQFPIDRVLTCDVNEFRYLEGIKGIGKSTVQTIMYERGYFIEDLMFIFSTFKYTKTPPYNSNKFQPKVCFTGFRDQELEDKFKRSGYEISDTVTKDTAILVVSHMGGTSTKINKAFKYLSENYAKATHQPKIQVTWDNLNILKQMNLSPLIVTRDEAEYLSNILQVQ